MKAALLVWAAFALGCSRTEARDLYVGRDVPTIAHAIKAAQPGDTIHLEPIVYRDYAGFYGKKGEPGKPITLDGHGATLDGSEPLDPAQWREVEPGLFAADKLLPRLDDAIVSRWFFLFDGRMNRMGRTSKGRSVPLKSPSELQPGEWTFVQDPTRVIEGSRQIFGAFYVRLASGQSLADAKIRAPIRSAGVQFSWDNAHLVIRNLTATHVYNDGFNIHGDCRAVVFENIRAIECGDDGISAHESAQYRVDGFASIGNSTGICDTGTAQTSYERVFIADCVGFDLYFLDAGRYRLRRAIVLSSSQNPLFVTGRESSVCELEVDELFIRRAGPPATARVTKTARLHGRRLTFEKLPLLAEGDVALTDSVLDGKLTPDSAARGADVRAILATFQPSLRAEASRAE